MANIALSEESYILYIISQNLKSRKTLSQSIQNSASYIKNNTAKDALINVPKNLKKECLEKYLVKYQHIFSKTFISGLSLCDVSKKHENIIIQTKNTIDQFIKINDRFENKITFTKKIFVFVLFLVIFVEEFIHYDSYKVNPYLENGTMCLGLITLLYIILHFLENFSKKISKIMSWIDLNFSLSSNVTYNYELLKFYSIFYISIDNDVEMKKGFKYSANAIDNVYLRKNIKNVYHSLTSENIVKSLELIKQKIPSKIFPNCIYNSKNPNNLLNELKNIHNSQTVCLINTTGNKLKLIKFAISAVKILSIVYIK